ncbi:hypothetical protein [Sphingomonas sp.]|uniref:hypothetical protein n=1 Tax=Sphingomonas sp. TaxID=28214 RepID=UPI002DD67621|nr:hypothetical protein [Sphingomonas sp.]
MRFGLFLAAILVAAGAASALPAQGGGVPIPDDYRITFRGQYNITSFGQRRPAPRRPVRPATNIFEGVRIGNPNVPEPVGVEGKPRPSAMGRDRYRPIALEAVFAGTSVTMTLTGEQPHEMGMPYRAPVALAGTRRGNYCDLRNGDGAITYRGTCDRDGFRGTMTALYNGRAPVSGDFAVKSTRWSTGSMPFWLAMDETLPAPDTPAGVVYAAMAGTTPPAYRQPPTALRQRPTAPAVLWHGKPAETMIGGRTFYAAIGENAAAISAFLQRKGGSRPVFSPVIAYTARDPAKGDYILPFCFAGKAGCSAQSSRIDGVVVIRRSGTGTSNGVFLWRDVGPKQQEFCALGAPPRCEMHPFGDGSAMSIGTSGKWDRNSVSAQTWDGLAISVPAYARLRSADLIRDNARYAAEALAARQAERRSCLAQAERENRDAVWCPIF